MSVNREGARKLKGTHLWKMSYYQRKKREREIDQSLIPTFTASIIVCLIYINNLLKAFFILFSICTYSIPHLLSPHWINNLINIYIYIYICRCRYIYVCVYIYIYMCVCIYVHLFHKEYQPITRWKHFYYFILFSISPYSLLYCLQSEFLTNKTKNILFIHSTCTLVTFLVFMCTIIMHNNKLLGNLNWKMGKTYCKKKDRGACVFSIWENQ